MLETTSSGDCTPSIAAARAAAVNRSQTDGSVASRHWAEAQLEICGRGANRTVLVPPESKELVVGAGRSAGLRLDDRTVSRRHCRFVRGAEGVVVEDLGSKHGTVVAGETLQGSRRLHHGDEIRIGQTVLRYLCYYDLIAEGALAAAPTLREGDAREPAVPKPASAAEAPSAPASAPRILDAPRIRPRLALLAVLVRRCWIPLAAALVATGVIVVIVYAVRAAQRLPAGGLN